ncbi:MULTISPECIES: DUF6134 family protein [Mesonia]|uniref:DUF6134 family protein n=2 Tax=Flavobacteriaceae TaxID=49546 RepID=UPI0024BB806C|nr:DUF6134 family protein [Mesonia mobilis]
MKKLLLLFPILILFAFTSSTTQEERHVFDIIHKGKSIGTLYAKKEQVGSKTIYSNRTEIDTRIIAKIEVDYNYKVVYENSKLSHAYVLILFNGKEKTNTYTDKNSEGYIFYEDDEEENRIHESITYGTVNLMFEEPETIQKVYAEEHGTFHSIKKVDSNTYEKTSHKGKTSIYKYKDGELVEAEIDAGLISFKIVVK